MEGKLISYNKLTLIKLFKTGKKREDYAFRKIPQPF